MAYVIVGFGDSIAKGTPYVEENEGDGRRVGGFEPELERLLEAAGDASSVYNWGVGGENTLLGAQRLGNVIDKYDNLDYVIILEGNNDLELFASQVTVGNLRSMIHTARANGVEPVLSTLTPDTSSQERYRRIRDDFNPKIRDLAEEEGVLLADLFDATAGNWDGLNFDGVHLNSSGYNVLAQVYFETLSNAVARTLDASAVTETSAALNGEVRPNGIHLRYYFEYGTDKSYGNQTETAELPGAEGVVGVSQNIGQLKSETSYHFRVSAVNDEGNVIHGGDRTFTTSNTTVTTTAATDVSDSSATLNGIVRPNGHETSFYFEYGNTTTYGQTTPAVSAGNGFEEVPVSAELEGLAQQTEYHYRLVITRASKVLYGNDAGFVTEEESSGSSGCFIQTIQ